MGNVTGGASTSRVPCQPVPPSQQRRPCPCCPLPTCTRGPWLGMNVAKQGGSAPARSRHGKRHTRPCALSRGGPGRQRGDEGICRARGVWVSTGPVCAQPAGPGTEVLWLQQCLQPCRPGSVGWHGRAQVGAAGALSPQAVTPLSLWWEARGCSLHAGTGGAEALGRETPSRWQRMGPSRAPSEQGAGQEINSGVSSCPGWGHAGEPPRAPAYPQHSVAAGSGRQGIIAFLRRVCSSFVMVKNTSEAPLGLGGCRVGGKEGVMPPICPLVYLPASGIVKPLNSLWRV